MYWGRKTDLSGSGLEIDVQENVHVGFGRNSKVILDFYENEYYNNKMQTDAVQGGGWIDPNIDTVDTK